MKNSFEIEKEVYLTQWRNITFLWNQTITSVRNLTALIFFAVFPLKFYVGIVNNPKEIIALKHFSLTVIAAFGLLTFLTQLNNNKRSKEARDVVVNIEKKWELYNSNGKFIFQNNGSKYAYGKFSGGEKRLSHSKIQLGYIVSITVVGLAFVWMIPAAC